MSEESNDTNEFVSEEEIGSVDANEGGDDIECTESDSTDSSDFMSDEDDLSADDLEPDEVLTTNDDIDLETNEHIDPSEDDVNSIGTECDCIPTDIEGAEPQPENNIHRSDGVHHYELCNEVKSFNGFQSTDFYSEDMNNLTTKRSELAKEIYEIDKPKDTFTSLLELDDAEVQNVGVDDNLLTDESNKEDIDHLLQETNDSDLNNIKAPVHTNTDTITDSSTTDYPILKTDEQKWKDMEHERYVGLQKLRELEKLNTHGQYDSEIVKLQCTIFPYKDMSDLKSSEIRYTPANPDFWNDGKGARGNSLFSNKNNKELTSTCKKYGQNGVNYINGNPDFRPFTNQHDDRLGDFNSEVVIPFMAGDSKITIEDKTYNISGRLESNTKKRGDDITNMTDKGNYRQADEMLAKKLGVSIQEVKDYRTHNKMTWHECRDGATMQLIPTILHDTCKHQGGVSMLNEEIKNGTVERTEPRFTYTVTQRKMNK